MLFVTTIALLIALIVKKNEAPINFYLLLAFVCAIMSCNLLFHDFNNYPTLSDHQ